MSNLDTGIEWTGKTWNPITGCDKISPGCLHCYAETITKRFPKGFPHGFKLTLHPDRLKEPFKWKTPSKVFVNSMSDLFHDDVPLDFIYEVFDVCGNNPRHTFQILTKRHERLLELADKLTWFPNIWMGVSVENQRYVERVDSLRQVPAAVRFLSCEPLLGELNLNLDGIHWLIAGGESGRGYRKLEEQWVLSLRDQCQSASVPFFFKQWGGATSKAGGNTLEGRKWLEFPEAPKVPQAPAQQSLEFSL